MSDRVFYVGARPRNDEKKITGYVPAKFLTLNGKSVVDPTPGGSQIGYIYADGSDRYKTRGEIANPNNYLIVPANYTEQQARAFAAEIANTVGQVYPGDETGAAGFNQALGRMTGAFWPNGPQDLQRYPQWGIPENSFVPAFTGSASYHLGAVTRWAGLPVDWSEIGGGFRNRANAGWQRLWNPPVPRLGIYPTKIDANGPRGLSWHNYDNIVKGFADADVPRNGASPTNDFGYNVQNQYPPGQIGDGNGLGVGDWRFAFAGVDPSNPTQPVPPLLTDSKPAPRLVRVNGSPSSAPPASPVDPSDNRNAFGERFGNWTGSPEGGTTPRNPNLPTPSPEPGRPLGIFTGKPMPLWTVPPPLGGLLGNSNPSAGNSGNAPSSPPPASQKSQGSAVPYLLEYLQYLKQLDGR